MPAGNALNTLMNALPGYAMQLYQGAQQRKALDAEHSWKSGESALDRSAQLQEAQARLQALRDQIAAANARNTAQIDAAEGIETRKNEREDTKVKQNALANKVIENYFAGLSDNNGNTEEFYDEDAGTVNPDFWNQHNSLTSGEAMRSIAEQMATEGVKNPYAYLTEGLMRTRLGTVRDDETSRLLEQLSSEVSELPDTVTDEQIGNYVWNALGSDTAQKFASTYPGIIGVGTFSPGVSPREILGLPYDDGNPVNQESDQQTNGQPREITPDSLAEFLMKLNRAGL